MTLSLLALWALAGWCLTGVHEWWLKPLPLIDFPEEPPPGPDWIIPKILGVVGGVIGGWVFTEVFVSGSDSLTTIGPQGDSWMPLVRAAATTVGAAIGATLLTDSYRLIRGGGKRTRR